MASYFAQKSSVLLPSSIRHLKAKRARPNQNKFTGGCGYAGQAPGGGGAVARLLLSRSASAGARTSSTTFLIGANGQKKCKKNYLRARCQKGGISAAIISFIASSASPRENAFITHTKASVRETEERRYYGNRPARSRGYARRVLPSRQNRYYTRGATRLCGFSLSYLGIVSPVNDCAVGGRGAHTNTTTSLTTTSRSRRSDATSLCLPATTPTTTATTPSKPTAMRRPPRQHRCCCKAVPLPKHLQAIERDLRSPHAILNQEMNALFEAIPDEIGP